MAEHSLGVMVIHLAAIGLHPDFSWRKLQIANDFHVAGCGIFGRHKITLFIGSYLLISTQNIRTTSGCKHVTLIWESA